MKRNLILALLLLVIMPSNLNAQKVGPARGSLVLVGGAMEDEAIIERFLDLAGGPDAAIVVIPTAGEADDYDPSFYGLRQFREHGVTNLTLLHTRDRAVADSDDFVAVIREANGVWFSGGRQWRLADAYLGTETETELWKLLARGGVIGGSSAGATIQGSYLVRGDTETNTIMMGDHEEGFGFLKDVAIDQHVLQRNRHFDLIEIIEARPELLGLGIDENTAIVVQGEWFDVIGASYVVVYDRQKMIGDVGRFYFLAPGDRYNLTERTAYRAVSEMRPLERVEERPWEQ